MLVSAFAPFGSVAFDAPSETPLSDVANLLAARFPHLSLHTPSLVLSSQKGPLDSDPRPLAALCDASSSGSRLVSLRIAPRLLGGKGGFGSQLRAAGGRMSSQKTSNNDSCRDLSGRRISTVKEATRMAEYIESEPARKKAAAEAAKAKLEALEKQLGIDPTSSPGAGSSSAEPAKIAGKKHRFDDTQYLEQSRDIVDGVKSAVAAGLLKKRKKAKLDTAPATPTPPSAVAAVSEAAKEVVKDAAASADTPIVAAAAAAAVGAVAAAS